jgi:hypothetical protein
LEQFKLYILTRDSLLNAANSKKIAEQQMQYEFDKKELAIKAEQDKKDLVNEKKIQKQKLVRNGFIGGFAIMMLFAVVFFGNETGFKKEKSAAMNCC